MYDYVIVGAGSAGCVLAARLTEDPDVRVLLLEAGPPDVKDNIHVPLGFLKLGRTDVDWDLRRRPSRSSAGGASTCRGARPSAGRRRSTRWSTSAATAATTTAGASPAGRGTTCCRTSSSAEDNERGASDLHGAGGPLAVSENRSRNPMSLAWVEGAAEAGVPLTDDFNGPEQDGAGMYQVTQRDGMRASTSVVYLHPALERPNLEVRTWTLAHRVVFEGGRAVGVEASRLDDVEVVPRRARGDPVRRRVHVAAAAPVVGRRAGRAPGDEGDRGRPRQRGGRGEPVDHPAVSLVWTTSEEVSLLVALEAAALEEFETQQTGPLTSNFAEAGAFVRLGDGLDAPDLQYHAVPVQIVDEGHRDPTDHGIWMAPCVLQPESRGSVRLASNDPSAKPIIRHNYYAAEADMQTQMRGIRHLMEIASQPALRRYCTQPFTVPESDSDDDVRAHIAAYTGTLYHPVGTCAIGSVVDDQLRVPASRGCASSTRR